MPRVPTIQTNFTAGEWSPRLRGRVDLAKYRNACACLHNYLVLPQGGVTRRPGLRYVAEVKTSAWGAVRLLAFRPTDTVAYVIEAGCEYFRFYRNSAAITVGGTPCEVATPYAQADLACLRVVPSVDVLYLLHPSYQTRKLSRYSDQHWRLECVAFAPPPSLEFGHRPDGDLVPAAASGENVTIEARNADSFLASDVGREILVLQGPSAGARAGIKSLTSAKEVIANICTAFASVAAICNKLWKLTASPLTAVTPSAHTPVDASVTLTLAAAGWRGAADMRPSDCGKFVLANGGTFEITSVTSTTVANARIRGTATGTAAAAQSGAWTLEEALWSACNGWAEVGTFHDGRLYLAAGHRFAGSKSGDYENFALGAADDDAVLFALDADTLQHIRWLRSGRSLQIGTVSSEWQAIGGTEAPITASNIQVRGETHEGAARVAPVVAGTATLFVTASGRQLREFVLDPQSVEGTFTAPDLLLLAEHLTRRATPGGTDPTLIDLALQRHPDRRVWAVRSDGVLLALTYLRDQEVIAWSRLTTAGWVEAVAVIPHPDGDRDQVWVAVRRTINAVTRRYIEWLDDAGLSYPTLHTDAAWICTSATAVRTVSGLAHLECATVQIVADGAVRPSTTVIGGNVTFAAPCATKIEIGLAYTSDLTLMPPEVPLGGMTSQLNKRRWAKLAVRLHETLGMTLGTEAGEEIVPFRTSADAMGAAPALFTGDLEIPHLGWDEGQVTIRQTQPLPSTVLAVLGVLDLGGS